MPRIAISGHRGLPPETAGLITRAVQAALREAGTEAGTAVTGLSCLADGADQIFARAVLDMGGTLEAVIPASRYRADLPDATLEEFDALLAASAAVHEMPFTQSTSESHMAASVFMIDHADELWAVWDGLPARGYGGTADVVAAARDRGLAVRVLWPPGARRA